MERKYIIRRINRDGISYLRDVNNNSWLPSYDPSQIILFQSKEDATKVCKSLTKVDKCSLEIVEILMS